MKHYSHKLDDDIKCKNKMRLQIGEIRNILEKCAPLIIIVITLKKFLLHFVDNIVNRKNY